MPGNVPISPGNSGTAVLPYLQIGFVDPTAVATPGSPGMLYLRVPINGDPASQAGLFMKITTEGNDTNWLDLSAAAASGITVLEEGVPLAGLITSMDFVGAGVTATLTAPGLAQISVPGGSASLIDGLFFVAENGNDGTGDGSIGAPYLTIQAAINAASAAGYGFAKPAQVLILPSSVAYAGFSTVSGINIFGLHGDKELTKINGQITCTPDGTGLATNLVQICNLRADHTGTPVVGNSTANAGKFIFRNCSLNQTGGGISGVVLITAGAEVDFDNCYLSHNADIALFAVGGTVRTYNNTRIVCGGEEAVRVGAGTTLISSDTTVEQSSNFPAIRNAGTIRLFNCSISNSSAGANADAILMSAGSSSLLTNCQLSVVGGENYDCQAGATLAKSLLTLVGVGGSFQDAGSVITSPITGLGYQPATNVNWTPIPANVKDALDYLAANPAGNQLIFKPGGVAGKNVYNTWPDIMAALALLKGPTTIFFDDSNVSPCVIPAGAYAFTEVTFDNFRIGETTLVEVADLVTFTGLVRIKDISISFLNSTIVDSLVGSKLIYFDGCTLLANGTSAIWDNSATVRVVLQNGADLNGVAAVPVFNINGANTLEIVLNEACKLKSQSVAGGAATGLSVFFNSSSAFFQTQTNLSGVETIFLNTNAFREGYTPTTPADWTTVPTNVGQALNILAAAVGGGGLTTERETTPLTAPIIAAGFIDLGFTASNPTVIVNVQGAGILIVGTLAGGDDCELSVVGAITRVTFSPAVLALMTVGQKVQIQYGH